MQSINSEPSAPLRYHLTRLTPLSANKQCSEAAFADLARDKRAQFLPIRWRTNLNLEEGSIDKDASKQEDGTVLRISDFEPAGIPFVREMISNVLIDIPHYLSNQHRNRLIQAVVEDCNRVYRLFVKRNPDFTERGGKVHIIAHSLGSALAIDILSNQPTYVPPLEELSKQQLHSVTTLCFNTSSCFFLGSPAGFFYFLNGAKLVARKGRARTRDAPADVALDETRYGCLAVGACAALRAEVSPTDRLTVQRLYHFGPSRLSSSTCCGRRVRENQAQACAGPGSDH
jgi:hypothetical protein